MLDILGDTLRQAEAALKKVDGLGLQGEELRNVAAATALHAQNSGMERIDGALLGKNGQVFAYQGDPASESADRVAVNIAQAKQQPANQSLATMAIPDPQQGQAQQLPKLPGDDAGIETEAQHAVILAAGGNHPVDVAELAFYPA